MSFWKSYALRVRPMSSEFFGGRIVVEFKYSLLASDAVIHVVIRGDSTLLT